MQGLEKRNKKIKSADLQVVSLFLWSILWPERAPKSVARGYKSKAACA